MIKIITRFLVRWAVTTLGLWIAVAILGEERIGFESSVAAILISGLVLSLVNMIIKPIVVLLSLPALLFSLGLFMIIINGLMLMLASWLYSGLHVEGFGVAMLAGMIIGLVNYLVTLVVERGDK